MPRICTCKAILGRRQPGPMRWILLWIMPLVQDQSSCVLFLFLISIHTLYFSSIHLSLIIFSVFPHLGIPLSSFPYSQCTWTITTPILVSKTGLDSWIYMQHKKNMAWRWAKTSSLWYWLRRDVDISLAEQKKPQQNNKITDAMLIHNFIAIPMTDTSGIMQVCDIMFYDTGHVQGHMLHGTYQVTKWKWEGKNSGIKQQQFIQMIHLLYSNYSVHECWVKVIVARAHNKKNLNISSYYNHLDNDF